MEFINWEQRVKPELQPNPLMSLLAEVTQSIFNYKEKHLYPYSKSEYREFIKGFGEFLRKMRDYLKDIKAFQRTGDSAEKDTEQHFNYHLAEYLKNLDKQRKEKHNSLMLNFIRLSQLYQRCFERKIPGPGIFIDKNGFVKKDFLDKSGDIDLTKISSEEREQFSEWAVKIAQGLEKLNKSETQEEKPYLDLLENEERETQTYEERTQQIEKELFNKGEK